MTDTDKEQNSTAVETPDAGNRGAFSRRRFVRRAFATAPILVTLPSGAALARSSNVIATTTTAAGAKDALGRTLCLDLTSGSGPVAGGIDLGEPPSGRLSAITDRDYRVGDRGSADPITEDAMCQNGGIFYYQSSGWQQVSVPKGMLVSATALSSFAGSVVVREI